MNELKNFQALEGGIERGHWMTLNISPECSLGYLCQNLSSPKRDKREAQVHLPSVAAIFFSSQKCSICS